MDLATHDRTPAVPPLPLDDSCPRCGCQMTNIVTPRVQLIDTVGITCFACGMVRAYADDLLIVEPSAAEIRRRRFQRFNDARPVASSRESMIMLVLMGMDTGLPRKDIADLLGVEPAYVDRILTLVGENLVTLPRRRAS